MDLFAGHLPELIIVLVLVLIVWGPGKIPEVGAAVGRGIREFRKASAETRDAVRRATEAPEEPPAPTPAQAAPPAEHEAATFPEGPSTPGAS
jgi:sec-independent protein translocase protein TatA